VVADGDAGEFWSTASSLEIVTCLEADRGQDPGEAQPDQPGILSRPVLLAGLAVLLVLLIAGAYWLGQRRGRA
jgi:hypothetical protein